MRLATVSGGVIDGSGNAIRHATVRLNGPTAKVTTSDENGWFTFRDLPPGRYSLLVTKPGFVAMQYGQRRATDLADVLSVTAGARLDGIRVTLSRGGVIAGRVHDELGGQVAGAVVNVFRVSRIAGQRRITYFGVAEHGPPRSDDLGQFRVGGLAPGEYFVAAATGARFLERAGGRDYYGYARTYFPNTADLAKATPVRVADGAITDLDISLVRARQISVSGTVTDSRGRAAAGALVRLLESAPTVSSPAMTSAKADGSFALDVLALPGSYLLMVLANSAHTDGSPLVEKSSTVLELNGGNLTGLGVTLSPAVGIRGTVSLDGRPVRAGLRVFAVPIDSQTHGSPGTSTQTDATGRFELKNLYGRLWLGVDIPAGDDTYLHRIRVAGQDLSDSGVDIERDDVTGPVEIELRSDAASISGSVSAGGSAAPDVSVLVFAADESKWVVPQSRYIRHARSDARGEVSIQGLVPGTYRAIAVGTAEAEWLSDPTMLQRLRRTSIEVNLTAGMNASIVLKVDDFSRQ